MTGPFGGQGLKQSVGHPFLCHWSSDLVTLNDVAEATQATVPRAPEQASQV